MEVIENSLISRMLQIVLPSWKKDLPILLIVVDGGNVDRSEKTDLSSKSRGKGDCNCILCSVNPYPLLDGFDLRVGTDKEVLRRIVKRRRRNRTLFLRIQAHPFRKGDQPVANKGSEYRVPWIAFSSEVN